jgi:serine/threonine-protein kinase
VILYEALSNVRPFEGETVPEVCAKVLKGVPVPLERRRRDLPRPLCEVVGRCLHKDRDQRFATAGDLRQALLACR